MDVLAVPRNLQHGRFEHSPEEWEAHRTHIKSLYIEEQKKLSDVRRRMEVDHGFYATYVISPLFCYEALNSAGINNTRIGLKNGSCARISKPKRRQFFY
jgi:hypothetical protein